MNERSSHVVFIDEPASHDELYTILINELGKGTGKVEIFFPNPNSWKNHVGDLSSLRMPAQNISDENPLKNTEAYKLENLLMNSGYNLGSSYDFSACCVRYHLG